MFIFRAIRQDDLGALVDLARKVGSGMTTLKPDPQALEARVELAVRSFAGQAPATDRDFVFVLEEQATGAVAGVSALKAAVGLDEPFYNFRLGRLVHSSRELGIYADKRTLYLTNDYTGCAELCTLFLDPAFRGGENGRLLSKARLMFAANGLELLPQTLIAELRGFQRDDGTSPFWESLGRHFFRMDFAQADDISSLGPKSFIAELKKHDLLMDGELSLQMEGQEQPFTYRGFQMVDENKLREMRGDVLRSWNQNGLLPLIYAHLFSLDLVREIFGRQLQLGKGPIQAPQPA